MFHFDFPWFALLLPLPLLIRLKKREGESPVPTIRFPAIHRLKAIFPTTPVGRRRRNLTRLIPLWLSWICLIVAMMQPEKVDRYVHVKNTGYDLMLAVDISGSMQAVDFSTQTKVMDRLDVTKEVVGKFVLSRQGDRVGLITFGQYAYLYVPLTLDTLSVSKMLNQAVVGMAGNATAIGDAIGLSVKTLRERPAGSRVLVLLTDGEDNASSIPPIEAAKLAKQYGIRIYTIGVGKNGPVPFPNRMGGYGMVEVPMDEELLKEIAHITNGHYFHATDKKSLQSIYSKIDQLEKSEANETVYLIRDPLYMFPLGTSMALLLIQTLFFAMHRPKPIFRGVYES